MIYMTTLFTDICTSVTRLTSGIFSLKEGVNSVYGYMSVLTNHGVNPLGIPPLELWNILLDTRQNICLHPTWPCQMIQMIISGLIILYCKCHPLWWKVSQSSFHQTPLVDTSLQMDLYKVYNLPALQPELKVQFSYALKGEDLTISTSHIYATISISHEIHICLAS